MFRVLEISASIEIELTVGIVVFAGSYQKPETRPVSTLLLLCRLKFENENRIQTSYGQRITSQRMWRLDGSVGLEEGHKSKQ